MEERSELIKELFELHRLLADKGEISIGYGFSENFKKLESQVKKLTKPNKEEIKNERKRIWNELCKGRADGAFTSTLELEEDNVYDIIFNDKKYKF